MLTHLLRLLFIASSLLISISINCANVKTPSSQPDFAFPKQVSSDARLRLSKALDTHDGIGCLRAIIDLQLAQSMVDPDSTVAFMSLIATICNQTADPVIKSLLEILQARIYAEAYENDRWNLDTRKLPLHPIPADFRLWSGEQYRFIIDSLAMKAASRQSALAHVPLRDFSSVITCPAQSAPFFPSLYDFVAWQSIRLLKTGIHFNNLFPVQCLDTDYSFPSASSSEALAAKKISSVFASLIKQSASAQAPLLNNLTQRLAFFSSCVYHTSMEKCRATTYRRLLELSASHASSPYSALPLLEAGNYMDDSDNAGYYKALGAYLKKFPASEASAAVTRKMKLMTSAFAEVTVPSSVFPSHTFSFHLNTRGISEATVTFHRLPPAFTSQNSLKVANPSAYPVAKAIKIDLSNASIFGCDTTVTASLDKPGYYFAVITTSPSLKSRETRRSIIHCSSLAVATLKLHSVSALAYNPLTGEAVESASVYTSPTNPVSFRSVGLTDREGFLRIAEENSPLSACMLSVRKDSDVFAPLLNLYPEYRYKCPDVYFQAFTDLAIYHPGDTVRWVSIAYRNDGITSSAVKSLPVKAQLLDANYTEVKDASVSAVTDDFGRASGSFVIPKGLLQGYFSINIITDDKSTDGTSVRFMVSDYKMPGFMVDCKPALRDTPEKGAITLTGKVSTYSGMPLAGAEISGNLSSSSMPWWFRSTPGTLFYTFKSSTDAEGNFTVVIPSDVLDAAPAPRGLFTAVISAMSSSGESQETTVTFLRGSALRIVSELKGSLDVSSSPVLPVKVINSSDSVIDTPLSYTFVPSWSGNPGAELTGSFLSSSPVIDWTRIPSGRYRLVLKINDSPADSLSEEIIIYRHTDSKMPQGISDVLWTPTGFGGTLSLDRNGKGSLLLAAASAPTRCLYVLSDSSRIIERKWLELEEGFHSIPVSVNPDSPAPHLTLFAASGMKSTLLDYTVNIPHPERELTLKAESFRDRLVPGATETWKFTTVDGDGKPRRSAIILDMYNLALDALAKASFSFSPMRPYLPSLSFSTSPISNSIYLSLRAPSPSRGDYDITIPYFLTYGYSLYSPVLKNVVMHRALLAKGVEYDAGADGMGAVRSVNEAKIAAPAVMSAVTEESVEDAAGGETESSAPQEPSGDNSAAKTPFEYRSGNTALAFFRPMLTTDADGSLSFTFKVPDANTTWAFSALGFTDSPMSVASFCKKVLANKPVMVQPNLPRFLRTGDYVTVASLVMNNSDENQTVSAVTEIFDPATGQILQTSDTTLSLSPSSNASVSASFRAPESSPFIGFRVKASTTLFADGEQSLIPVLEAAEPLVESLPFYLSPDSAEYSLKLPEIPSDAFVSLQYCENPVWYVVTALPGLSESDPRTSIEAVDAWFSAAVAKGLLRKFPEIGRALSGWSESDKSDSTLVSMLERNAALKTVLLQATPWMLDARSDTERMQRLELLLDGSNIERVMSRSLSYLKSTQTSSGAWSWTKNYTEPSAWVTERVISRFAELRHLGFLDNESDISPMVNNGFNYLNRNLEKCLKDDKNYTDAAYAMVRTLWPGAPASASSRKVMANTIQHIVKNWKHSGVTAKAESAIILRANGYPSLASRLVASLEEFAVSTPEKGMWWPSAQSPDDISTLFSTAECLRALRDNNAPSSKIDAVVQWMILQKEANNWGSSAATSVICTSILDAASRWLVPAEPAYFTLADKPLDVKASDSRLGEVRTQLDASRASGSVLTIKRTGSTPAWGSVSCRYKMDMAAVPAYSIPDLSITKSFLKQEGTRWVEATDLKVGDRVRVNLTIVSRRAMDYVAVTDNRAACLEPVEQTPAPVFADGLCFYRENGDNATMLFISSLPAGTYQLGYDFWVNSAGSFASGTANIQSQYAPQLSAHSSGTLLNVTPASE